MSLVRSRRPAARALANQINPFCLFATGLERIFLNVRLIWLTDATAHGSTMPKVLQLLVPSSRAG